MNRSISSSDFSENEETCTFHNPSEQDRLLKNSNIFKQSKDQQQKNICAKHPNKKAKYYVAHDKRNLFCSKCALNLALRGVKIEETQETQLEIQRQQRIQAFQDQLKSSLDQCTIKHKEFVDLEFSCSQQLDEQREVYNQFFDYLITTATQLKQTYITKFENDNQGFIKQIQEHKVNVQVLEKQLKQFQADIEKNHENIVKRMEMKPFEEIMTRYERKAQQTKIQVGELCLTLQPKQIHFDSQQILTYLNKMCYNLLYKAELENNDFRPQSVKQSHSESGNCNPSSIDMKVFEILEGEDIYQSTYSNPIKEQTQLPTQSPIRLPIMKKGQTNSNPISTIQNSRRESHANTPESWQQRTCIQKVVQSNTPNERETVSHNASINEHSQKLVIEVSQRYQQEKQKTSSEMEKNNHQSIQPIIDNLSCLQLQNQRKIRCNNDSFDDKELTPKHTKNLTGPQTFKVNSQHASQRSQFSYPSVVAEQKTQIKGQYDSTKSLTPHHTQSQQQLVSDNRHTGGRQQEAMASRRSNSKVSKQASIDQNDGKRQFLLNNIAQYTTQPSKNEESLKDRIFKELCSHPGESVYNQVLKMNSQQKQKNMKQTNKENQNDYSATIKSKSNTFLCLKKQQ